MQIMFADPSTVALDPAPDRARLDRRRHAAGPRPRIGAQRRRHRGRRRVVVHRRALQLALRRRRDRARDLRRGVRHRRGRRERRLGPGDMAFFPAGSRSLWRVPVAVRKLAVCRHALPKPLGFVLRAWRKMIALATGEGSAMQLAPEKRSPSRREVTRSRDERSDIRGPTTKLTDERKTSPHVASLMRATRFLPDAAERREPFQQIVARLADEAGEERDAGQHQQRRPSPSRPVSSGA